jgi:hypothetical protein
MDEPTAGDRRVRSRLRIKTVELDAATRELAVETRQLAELLANRLGLGHGNRSIVELEFQDGRLVSLWRHEKMGAKTLDEVPPLPRDSGGISEP